jgi:hypothetical protein
MIPGSGFERFVEWHGPFKEQQLGKSLGASNEKDLHEMQKGKGRSRFLVDEGSWASIASILV